MKTIKDKELNKKVMNVIYNIDFGVFNREFKKERIIKDIEYGYELLKTYQELETKNQAHLFFTSKLQDFIQENEALLKEITTLEEIELPFVYELETKYERLNDGFYKYDVEWFEERISLLDLAKLTQDITKETLELMKEMNYPLYEEVNKK